MVFPRKRYKRLNPLSPVKALSSREHLHTAAALNGGQITSIDAADIPDNALTVAKNVRVRFDKTERREANVLFTPTKPDSFRIQRLFEFKQGVNERYLIRITPTTAYYTEGSAWTAFSGTLNGDTTKAVFHTVIEQTPVLANGVDRLKQLSISGGTISDLGTLAPRARYVTGMFNRVVAASVGNSGEGLITVYWSGDRNITEFDGAVDLSAGQSPILDSPADESDFITGIFGGPNLGILLREKSIWLIQKQPIESNPFHFVNVQAGIGCNVPTSAARIPGGGLVFFDTVSENVWVYIPRQLPEPIGDKVGKEITSVITNPSQMFSGFLRREREYVLGIGNKIWRYNFRTQAWVYDEISNISAVYMRVALGDFTSFDELTGTFDDLTGTMDELSAEPSEQDVVYYGRSDGDIYVEDETENDDAGSTFESELRSKEFVFDHVDTVLASIKWEYLSALSGSMTLEYSKDSGDNWVTAKTVTLDATGNKVKQMKFKKAVRARRIMWRLRTSDSKFQILDYEVRVYPGGESDD